MGGLENVAINIASNLDGYESHIWCLKYKGAMAKAAEEKGIKVRGFNFSGGLRIHSALKLAGAIRQEGFDVVHSHGLYPSMWAAFTAIFSGVPATILHCHSVYYGISKMDAMKLKILSRFARKVIAVSEAVKKSLVEFVGLDPKKVLVIHNGIPGMRPQDPRTKALSREKLGLKKSDFVIGHVGRLVRFKGQRLIVDAAARCRGEYPDFKWLIAGDGPEREGLEFEIKKFDLEDTVRLLGPRDDIEELLHAMDVFVNPSVVKEGLPLALIEASSAGLPLVATDVGGNSEVVEDEVNGFIVLPQETEKIAGHIRYLYENPAQRERMAASSRRIWNEKFRLEDMIRKIKAIYEDATSKH